MRHEGEPSVEEILESIKKVIARDNRDSAEALRRAREGDARPAQSPSQSLSQTPPQVAPQARPAASRPLANPFMPQPAADEPDDVLDLSAMALAEEDLTDDGFAGPSRDGEASEALTTEQAADAMRQSLAALAMLAEPPAAPRIVRSGETSLEGMVREMLRPMMAQWLDAHLPEIVERLVKAEIARIAGKKR